MYCKKRNMNFPNFVLALLLFCGFLLGSPSPAIAANQTPIMGPSLVNKEQMIQYLQTNNSASNYDDSSQFVSMVIREANTEGVRPEVAFSLMMKETNYLKFTGTVKATQNNFGGLGVTGPGVQGASFDSVQVGIRAIIQHLQAYASELPLKQPVVDPRYTYVTRCSAPYAEWLGIQENPTGKGWATDPGYGYDIVKRVDQIKAILPMRLYVDTPTNGSAIKGTTTISGWSLNKDGIAKVELYHGTTLQQATTSTNAYPSVNVVYPGYSSGNNSGYSMAYDTTQLPNGTQTFSVVATGKDGAITTWPLTLVIANPPMRMYVDTPTDGSTVRGVTKISGWALNVSGISKVQIFEGSRLLGAAANVNLSYPSVNVVYPGYSNGNNSGYSYDLDTTNLADGVHTLKIQATGINGEVTSWNIQVRVDNAPKMYVDTPTSGSTIKGTTTISGWSVNMKGIAKVELYKGTTLLETTTSTNYYPSVNVVYPGYPSGNNSGYSMSYDTTQLANGTQTFSVVATGTDGVTTTWPLTLVIANPPVRMYVDTPTDGSTIRGIAKISGWALNKSDISKVEIFEGSSLVGAAANVNLYYPTVNIVYPGYSSGDNSGYSYDLDTTKLADGVHTLKVQATRINGEVVFWNIQVSVDNAPRMYVDTPTSGSAISGVTKISGWALNVSRISKVEIFEGSSLLGATANVNLYYPSVNVVYPGYSSGNNSGFSYDLDTTKLANGVHTLKVQATGINGEVTYWNIQVMVNPPGLLAGQIIVLDPGHGTPDPGAVGPAGSMEKDGNLAIAQRLAKQLRAAGAVVYLTRDGDCSPASPYNKHDDLWSRVNFANALSATLFISIHTNSGIGGYGTETYYSNTYNEFHTETESRKLANSIQNQLVERIGLKDRGVKDGDLTVLNHTIMPAVLVEVAFISNQAEEILIANDNFRENAATGIYKGILAYRGFY